MEAFWKFLAENKVWWITPLIVVLGLVAFLLYSDMTADDGAPDEGFHYDMY